MRVVLLCPTFIPYRVGKGGGREYEDRSTRARKEGGRGVRVRKGERSERSTGARISGREGERVKEKYGKGEKVRVWKGGRE